MKIMNPKTGVVGLALSLILLSYVNRDYLQSLFTPKETVVSQEQAETNFALSHPQKLLKIAKIVGVEDSQTQEVKNLVSKLASIRNKELINKEIEENQKILSILEWRIKQKDIKFVLQRYAEFIKNNPEKEVKLKIAQAYLEKELYYLPKIIEATEDLRKATMDGDKNKIEYFQKLLAQYTDELYVEGTENFDSSQLATFATSVK